MFTNVLRQWRSVAAVLCIVCPLSAVAQESRQLAPGFQTLPPASRVVVAPIDVELFEMGLGGTLEPKADWTANAQKHMADALRAHATRLGMTLDALDDVKADEFAEILQLHGAVAGAIALHHYQGNMAPPTKAGRLDWSFGPILQPLRDATGARYALFTWVRDSYASAGRKAGMVIGAMFGVGLSGGIQVGYASLVDLDSGQVLWFNRLVSGSGDLREPVPAQASVVELLRNFPSAR